MGQCVKFSEEAMSQIREKIGLQKGILNLKTGIWMVNSRKDIEQAAEMYDIDNINNRNKSASNHNLSLEERRNIIGTEVQVGSIVRVKECEKACHIVIISVNGQWYEGAKIILDYQNYDPETEILLVKGKDVIYRNLTYKSKVRVLKERVYRLKEENFIKGRAGEIVGKVVAEKTMQSILDLFNSEADDRTERCSAENGGEVGTESRREENKRTDSGNDQKENIAEVAIKMQQEEKKKEIKKEPEKINFEVVIQEAQTYEEWAEKLKLPKKENLFMDTIRICMRTNSYGMKKIVPLVQAEHTSEKLSQNAIKNIITEEFNTWLESTNVDMKERNLSYFLKVITKKYKNSYKN